VAASSVDAALWCPGLAGGWLAPGSARFAAQLDQAQPGKDRLLAFLLDRARNARQDTGSQRRQGERCHPGPAQALPINASRRQQR
jgi:hypothetical protein